MLIIPTNPIPNQTLNIVLADQACQINIYQKFWGLFCDLFVANQPIIQGVLALNQNYIVRSLYLGFIGDLAFVDTNPSLTMGASDPSYSGLGSRFVLLYLETTDLPPTYGLSQ